MYIRPSPRCGRIPVRAAKMSRWRAINASSSAGERCAGRGEVRQQLPQPFQVSHLGVLPRCRAELVQQGAEPVRVPGRHLEPVDQDVGGHHPGHRPVEPGAVAVAGR